MPSVVCMGYVALILGAITAFVIGVIAYGVGLLLGKKYSIKNAWLKSLPIAVLVALAVGCLVFWVMGNMLMSSMYPPSPKRKPSEQDIIGLWQLTQDSLASIRREGYTISTHTIEFKEDGTFEMTNLPDLVWNFGKPDGKFVSGSGTWSIEKDVNGDWSIEVHFMELNGMTDNFITYFYLYGEKPPYMIYDYIGDPDSGRILTFEKSSGR